jgi:hypothetical protein
MLRRRFTYSNVVATLALVFAMSGGALAASKYLITSAKQIKPSVLSSLKGKAGPAGATGAAGAAGAVGPAGTAGAQGPSGSPGPAGELGAPGAEGKAGKNGANGAAGKEGSPWTDKGTLPEGATETGVWAAGAVATGATGSTSLKAAISFEVPLAKRLDPTHIHIFEGTTVPAGCSGTVVEEFAVAELKAAPGELCIWVNPNSRVTASQISPEDMESLNLGSGTHGLVLEAEGSEETYFQGTWAVTG